MPQMVKKGFKFEQTLRENVRSSDIIEASELVRLTGIGAGTLEMYLSRAEFSHIKKRRCPKRYCGIKEKDILKLKYLVSRRYKD